VTPSERSASSYSGSTQTDFATLQTVRLKGRTTPPDVAAALIALYEQFDPYNSRLKELASAWQMRDGAPNDHGDADYDQGVLDGVAALHAEVAPLVERFVALAPRLAPYGPRLHAAVARIQAGEHAYFLRPVIDSYHTVWFELHEELIGLLGRTREDEALAGRAE
jgi:pyruvate,orthophosphate dikinase